MAAVVIVFSYHHFSPMSSPELAKEAAWLVIQTLDPPPPPQLPKTLSLSRLEEKLHAVRVHPLGVLNDEQKPLPLVGQGSPYHFHHQALQVAVTHVRGQGGDCPGNEKKKVSFFLSWFWVV